jgi:hypothetical protein
VLVGLFAIASCASMDARDDSSVVRVEVVNPNITLTVGDPAKIHVSVINLTDETLEGLEFIVEPRPSYRADLTYKGGDIDPIPPRGSWSPPAAVGLRVRETGRVIITFEVWDDGVLLGKDIAFVRIAPDPFYE